MDSEDILTAKAGNDKAEQKVSIQKSINYEPDDLQRTTMELMARIDHQIQVHEEAIRKLNEAYMAYARFLMNYDPFETGNLSQSVSADMESSPGAADAPGREEDNGESIRIAT